MCVPKICVVVKGFEPLLRTNQVLTVYKTAFLPLEDTTKMFFSNELHYNPLDALLSVSYIVNVSEAFFTHY